MTEARLQRGMYVRVRLEGSLDEWVNAFVAVASDTNPSSVMLMFNGAVRAGSGLAVNALPLTIDYDAETVTSLFGDEYEIEVPA